MLDKTGGIYSVEIVPEKRGGGYGRLLLQDLVAVARKRKLTRLYLWVKATNTPARRLYTRVGFEETGTYYPKCLEPDFAVTMELIL